MTNFVDRSYVNVQLAWITASLEFANHVLCSAADCLTDQDHVENRMFIFQYVACYRCVPIVHRGLPCEFVLHVTLIAVNLLYSDVRGLCWLSW